jgi:tRNA threonylcarbamoyladenosine biosynthesis protein TsaE
MLEKEFSLKSKKESVNLAIKIAAQIKKGSIITFSGGLGVGKTFLCRHIIKYLCGEDVKVVSPTFNLLQIYPTKNFEIYHFDLYRLEHLEEIYELGIEEAFSGNHVCLIEWPEIISSILPPNTISIKISINSNNNRLVSIYKI